VFLPPALEYIGLARQRGEQMAHRATALLDEHHEDRLALVIGGFHSRAAVRTLEDRPDLSWCVLLPDFDPEAKP
jgi:hypothetical protein